MTIRAALTAVALAATAAVALTAGAPAGLPAKAAIIDADATGSLTVHKYEQPVMPGGAGGGAEVPSALISGLTPLPGVSFDIQRVEGLEFDHAGAWAEVDALAAVFDPLDPGAWSVAPHTLGAPATAVTGPSGAAVFPDLGLGLYLVTETGPATIDGKAVTGSLPFLVTVPITDPDAGDAWLYDVHVYPKNVLSAVHKTIADADSYVLEDGVVFTLTGAIPGGHVTSRYEFTDQLHSAFEFQSARVFIGTAESSDYVLTVTVGGLVTITLTEDGRTAALTAVQLDPGATVRAELTVTVLEPGIWQNTAQLTFALGFETVPGWTPDDPEPELPVTTLETPPVETRWATLEVLKHSGLRSEGLAGAVFELYGGHSADFAEASLLSIDGQSRFSTGPGGVLTIEGLRYSDFADDAAVASGDPGYNQYWLKEVTAPAGYTLLAEPIAFTVTAPVVELAIENLEVPGDDIAFTGAAIGGTVLLALALLGLGALVLARPRRRSISG